VSIHYLSNSNIYIYLFYFHYSFIVPDSKVENDDGSQDDFVHVEKTEVVEESSIPSTE
jgi:hypothetical protein